MNIMSDIRSFIYHLKAEVLRTRGEIYSDNAVAASNILPLQHRLLCLVTAAVDEGERKVDILRLGCILFLAEVRRLFGIMGVRSSLHTRKLRQLLEQNEDSWETTALLKAWVLAMGAMESFKDEREWFVAKLRVLKLELGFDTWEDLQRSLQDILWYDDVHNTLMRELRSGVGVDDKYTNHVLGGSRFGGYRPLVQ